MTVGAALVCVLAAFARVNIYELMFHHLDHPEFAAAGEAHLDTDDMVLVIKLGAAARAYPIRKWATTMSSTTWLDGKPVVATY